SAEEKEERFLRLYSSVREVVDLADELDQKIAEVENGDKLRTLFYKLLNKIKVDVQEGDAFVIGRSGDCQSFRPIKPVSLGTLLMLKATARLREERRNWTREMWAMEGNHLMEQARSQAIADGTAIEYEWEAAIDD
ncbi:MAG: hypothetical protein ACE5PV_21615, partial [Candidatus Poribacteria bacterium]